MKVTISQAISELRNQLQEAFLSRPENNDILFRAERIDLELGVTFAVENKVGGGVSVLAFLDLSGERKDATVSTHKVTLSLKVDGKAKDKLLSSTRKPPANSA